jgi:hypothetical protein
MKTVQVEGYSGYPAEERPMRLKLQEKTVEIVELEDRWYSPGETYFRVVLATGDRYVLRHIVAQEVWSIAGFRGKGKESDETPEGRRGHTRYEPSMWGQKNFKDSP